MFNYSQPGIEHVMNQSTHMTSVRLVLSIFYLVQDDYTSLMVQWLLASEWCPNQVLHVAAKASTDTGHCTCRLLPPPTPPKIKQTNKHGPSSSSHWGDLQRKEHLSLSETYTASDRVLRCPPGARTAQWPGRPRLGQRCLGPWNPKPGCQTACGLEEEAVLEASSCKFWMIRYATLHPPDQGKHRYYDSN